VLHRRHLPRDLLALEKIVGVEPLDVLAAAQRQRQVSRRRRSLIPLRDDSDTARLELLRDSPRAVGGAVVDDDDLDAPPRLSERRPDRVGDPVLGCKQGSKWRPAAPSAPPTLTAVQLKETPAVPSMSTGSVDSTSFHASWPERPIFFTKDRQN
jgi:hypothetical protein